MKKLKSYTLLGIIAVTPLLFIGCDDSTPNEAETTELEQRVVRGLDLAEIANNPGGTPGFPFSLSSGETIDFVPDFVEPDSFIEQVPLGSMIAESSGFIRHAGGSTGNLYFPVTEQSFKLLYGTNSGAEPSSVSTLEDAFIEYSFEHRYIRSTEFVPRLEEIYDSADAPGSLQYVLINGGVVSNRDRTIIEAISSIGIAAVDHPTRGASARRFRAIALTGITSTNADLAGANPTITGTYLLRDTWQQVVTFDEGPVSLLHAHSPDGAHTADIPFSEFSTGTFTINLDALTSTP